MPLTSPSNHRLHGLKRMFVDRAGGKLRFKLLTDRYKRRSTIVTTNLGFCGWVQIFGDEKLTTALLNRLGHHTHILTTKCQSYRTRRRTAD